MYMLQRISVISNYRYSLAHLENGEFFEEKKLVNIFFSLFSLRVTSPAGTPHRGLRPQATYALGLSLSRKHYSLNGISANILNIFFSQE